MLFKKTYIQLKLLAFLFFLVAALADETVSTTNSGSTGTTSEGSSTASSEGSVGEEKEPVIEPTEEDPIAERPTFELPNVDYDGENTEIFETGVMELPVTSDAGADSEIFETEVMELPVTSDAGADSEIFETAVVTTAVSGEATEDGEKAEIDLEGGEGEFDGEVITLTSNGDFVDTSVQLGADSSLENPAIAESTIGTTDTTGVATTGGTVRGASSNPAGAVAPVFMFIGVLLLGVLSM